MKRHFFFLSFLFVAISSFSQTGVKVYGYEREVTPGIIQKDDEQRLEGQNKNDGSKALPNYEYDHSHIFYLSSPSKSAVTPIEIWVKGQRFSLTTVPVAKTPIVIPNKTGKSTTLVPKTTNKVQQVIAIPYTGKKEFSLARKKAASNELVVVYKQNGKYYSALLKKITVLEPQFSE